MSLQSQLDYTVEALRSAVPADIFREIGQSISDLKQTGQDARAVGVGATPALQTLRGLDGASIDLKALSAKRAAGADILSRRLAPLLRCGAGPHRHRRRQRFRPRPPDVPSWQRQPGASVKQDPIELRKAPFWLERP